MSKKLLGHVGVDSGQLMVTDPCYINMFKINEFNPQSKYYDKVKHRGDKMVMDVINKYCTTAICSRRTRDLTAFSKYQETRPCGM